MPLILVRHAETEWNYKGVFTGWTDVGLTEKGLADSYEMAQLFKKENITFDHIFTSDLQRTTLTAQYINTISPHTISSRLRERDYGDLTGKNKKETMNELGNEMFLKIRRGYYTRPSNGESLEDVCQRVGEYYETEIKPLNDKNILIVSHGNTIRALLVHLKIYTPEQIEKVEVNNCIPMIVSFTNGNPDKISYINKYVLKGLQILDSRGFPTIQVECRNKLTNKVVGKGSSPSGASCGSTEVLEMRDGDKRVYFGKSVSKAIANLGVINKHLPLYDSTIVDLKFMDRCLNELDTSDFKEVLGGNTTTAVSFCLAHAGSNLANVEMYEHIAKQYDKPSYNHSTLTLTPFVNIINGGKHSVTGELKIQEFMIFPKEDYSVEKKIQIITEVYHTLKKLLCAKYGESAKSIGDEGGFCPPIRNTREALDNIIAAIKAAHYVPNEDVFLALDCAASEFYNTDTQMYEIEQDVYLNSNQLVDFYGELIRAYPMLRSIEDGFYEKDYKGWRRFTELHGDKIMIVGDDLFTSNPKLIQFGLKNRLANSLLLKVNQIGTVSEAIQSANMFDKRNVIVSHRSGETNHAYIIDIAKGIGAQYVKIGSPCRGERVEKFNRILEIYN